MGIDMRIVSVTAHAHYLGKEIKAVATLPDGTEHTLLWIRDWDFNWQDQYSTRIRRCCRKGRASTCV